MCYPLLKAYKQDIPLVQQRKYNNQKNKYYKDLVIVNENKYLLCSQWYENFRDNFNNWVNIRNSTSVSITKYIKIRSNSNSVILEDNILLSLLEIMRNDFSYNQILIVKRLREQCERIIALNTKYKSSPQTVIYCLIGKLFNMEVIKLAPACSKGRYILENYELFDKICADRSILNE